MSIALVTGGPADGKLDALAPEAHSPECSPMTLLQKRDAHRQRVARP